MRGEWWWWWWSLIRKSLRDDGKREYMNRDNSFNKSWYRPEVVAHAYNLSTWRGQGSGSLQVRSSRPARPTWQNFISTKNTKISRVWWHTPVVPVIWEARAGELLEPGRWRLQWAKTAPLYPGLSDRGRLHLKNKQIKTKNKLVDFPYIDKLRKKFKDRLHL